MFINAILAAVAAESFAFGVFSLNHNIEQLRNVSIIFFLFIICFIHSFVHGIENAKQFGIL